MNRGTAIALLVVDLFASVAGAQAAAKPSAQPEGALVVALASADTGHARPDSQVAAAKADAPVPKWFDALVVNSFVSSGYEYNRNRPATGSTSYRVFDFSDNSFNLDVAELVVQTIVAKPNDAGFRVDVAAGNSIPQIAKTQDQALSPFDLQQAFASYIAPIGSGLRFDVGKYVTHLGYEVIEGYDGYDDNYSRSILFGYAIPFTHTGVKASYAFSSKVAAMVEVVNGWDLLRDNNRSKSVGAQLTVVPVAPVTLMLNWIGGPELANDNHSTRSVFDLVATYKPTATVTLGLNGDYGTEQGTSLVTAGADAKWKGLAGYATYAVTNRFSVGARGETFHDDGGVRLGTNTAATLSEATVTPAFRFTEHVVLRAELRHDVANQPILAKGTGFAKNQTALAANFIFVY